MLIWKARPPLAPALSRSVVCFLCYIVTNHHSPLFACNNINDCLRTCINTPDSKIIMSALCETQEMHILVH